MCSEGGRADGGGGDGRCLKAVEETLFFEGEYTDITGAPEDGPWAMGSGMRAAQQILERWTPKT